MGNSSIEGSHTSSSGTSASWENVANAYVLNELWVEVDSRVNGFENGRKHFLWMSILKTTLSSLGSKCIVNGLVFGGAHLAVADLCNGGSESGDDDDVIVVLGKDCRFSAHRWWLVVGCGVWGCGWWLSRKGSKESNVAGLARM